MNNEGFIDNETEFYLKPHKPSPGRFYILPKIHKTGNPGRPIVSSHSHPTISKILNLRCVDFYLLLEKNSPSQQQWCRQKIKEKKWTNRRTKA